MANGSLCAPPISRVPGERSETRDLGATRRIAAGSHIALCESARWIPALVPLGFASLHSAGTRDRRARLRKRASMRLLGTGSKDL